MRRRANVRRVILFTVAVLSVAVLAPLLGGDPFRSGFGWMFGQESLATVIPRFYLVCIALSIVVGEIRAVMGTFWPALLMHGAGNAIGTPLGRRLPVDQARRGVPRIDQHEHDRHRQLRRHRRCSCTSVRTRQQATAVPPHRPVNV